MNRRSFLLATLAAPWLRASELSGTLLVGDSLAFMLSSSLKVAGKRFGQEVRTRARGGTTTAQWLQRGWFKEALDLGPETVLISLGTNDWERDKFPERVYRLVELAHDRKIEVVWLIPPKKKAKFIREVVEKSGADFRHDASVLDIPVEKDGVHPTFKGLEVWANDLASFLWA
jgi:lysophospholipase L1-like esterase